MQRLLFVYEWVCVCVEGDHPVYLCITLSSSDISFLLPLKNFHIFKKNVFCMHFFFCLFVFSYLASCQMGRTMLILSRESLKLLRKSCLCHIYLNSSKKKYILKVKLSNNYLPHFIVFFCYFHTFFSAILFVSYSFV